MYKNAASMLFSNDEANIELVCMQKWSEEEKHLIWLQYLELMQSKELRYKDDFILTEIHFKNVYFHIAWWDVDKQLSFSSNLLTYFRFRKGYDEQLSKDLLTAFEKVIKQALDGAQS